VSNWHRGMSADLSGLDLVALLVDGVPFGEHTCVVTLGIALNGTKHPLALVEGSTENATLARELLVGLRERGLEVTRPILCAGRRQGAAPRGARRL
jgi:putative transposase